MQTPFTEDFLSTLDNFGAGLSRNITVISYQVVTPDMELLCFRTWGQDGNAYYFAMFSYDYLDSIKHARKLIGKSFAQVIEFLPPIEKQKGNTELEQMGFYHAERGQHYLIARTERPAGIGYWSSNIVVMPGDNIVEKLADLSEEDRKGARGVLANVMQNNPPISAKDSANDFLGTWMQKSAQTKLDPDSLTANNTNLSISIFKNLTGGWEAFFSHVPPKQD